MALKRHVCLCNLMYMYTACREHVRYCTFFCGLFGMWYIDRTACTEPQCLYNTAIPLLPVWAVRPVHSLSACTVQLYLYSPYGPYGLYRSSVPVQYSYTSTPPMDRTACAEPQCLYKGALYFYTDVSGNLHETPRQWTFCVVALYVRRNRSEFFIGWRVTWASEPVWAKWRREKKFSLPTGN